MANEVVPIEKKILDLFKKKTPAKYIKHRPGGNGKQLAYVPVGYVINELNNNFGPFWEWKLIYQQVFENLGQVAVTGELTVKSPTGFSITKTGSGGSAIKTINSTGKPLNIGWDIESASQLALKKAASKFGIASDVFYKEIDQYEQTPEVVDQDKNNDAFIKQQLIGKFFAVSAERGFNGDQAKEKIKKAFAVEHMEDLKILDLERGIKSMENQYQVVMPGEEPLRAGEFRKKPEAVKEEAVDTPETAPIENPEDVNPEEVKVDPEIQKAQEVFSRDPSKCALDSCKKTAVKHGFCSKEHHQEYWGKAWKNPEEDPWD